MSDNYIVYYGEMIKNFAQYTRDPYGIKKLAANKTEVLKELETLCLIELNYDSGFVFKKPMYLMYTNHYVDIKANNSSGRIPAGNVRFTADGQELFKFIEKKNNDRILEYSVQKWQNYDCSVNIIRR